MHAPSTGPDPGTIASVCPVVTAEMPTNGVAASVVCARKHNLGAAPGRTTTEGAFSFAADGEGQEESEE